MKKYAWDIITIEQFGSYSDKASCIKLLMLMIIQEEENGAGAWEIKGQLRQKKVELSPATVGRYLKELDEDGYTNKISNKGRVLTKKGEEYLSHSIESITANMLHKNMLHAVGGKEYQDLKNLYAVRMGVEARAIQDCCKEATDEEIEIIGKYAFQYEKQAEAGDDFVDISLDFHVLIAKATHNEFMEKVLTMLIYEQKRIENSLDYLASRESGKLFALQHVKIYRAIRQRNIKQATKILNEHFDSIIETFDE